MRPFSDTLVHINLMTSCFIIADQAGYLPWNVIKLDKYFPNFLSSNIIPYCMYKNIKTLIGTEKH